jgi:hypothetical protein
MQIDDTLELKMYLRTNQKDIFICLNILKFYYPKGIIPIKDFKYSRVCNDILKQLHEKHMILKFGTKYVISETMTELVTGKKQEIPQKAKTLNNEQHEAHN